jgi:tripartite-type tricarboxylate transporter receptor subunit TctC
MLRSAFALLVLALGIGGAHGETFPSRPVRLIVPFSAGGAVDVPARLIAQKLGEVWGQGVVVENRPGAGSTIGADLVAKSPPDGYTLLLTSNTHVISANLYRKLAYDAIADFEPVIEVGSAPNVLVVHPSFPARTVGELIAQARAKPGAIDYGSSGNGSSQHLFCALFASMAGIRMNHVPYKGSGQATTDLLAGRVPVSCPGVNNVLPYVKSGKLRALAVTSARRSAQLPEVPTLAEAGVAGYDATLWIGVLAPKGTPGPVLGKLRADIARVLALEAVKQGLAAAGTEVHARSGSDLAALMREENLRWGKLIAESGAKIE